MILSIRTDKPEAEIGLFDSAGVQLSYKSWQAHRELSSTILKTIEDVLAEHNATVTDVTGIIFFKGPGSFTGLRIGAAVANTLAVSLDIPLVQANGNDWVHSALKQLQAGKRHVASPEYGSDAHITKPVK
jgi:tRNA threonylcarbamoyladenosine biosynthesis protein TsaB